MSEQTEATTPSNEKTSPDGGYLTLAIATAALCISGFLAYQHWHSGGASSTCYRTIDMPKLTKFLISDMMEKTVGALADDAGLAYRQKIGSLDAEVSKHANGCLLVRRDMVVMPDPAIDITGEVAKAIGLDLTQPTAKQDVNPLSGRPASPNSSNQTSPASNELSSKLD